MNSYKMGDSHFDLYRGRGVWGIVLTFKDVLYQGIYNANY